MQRSKNNRIRLQEIKPLRGLILDTHGKVLVDNQPSFDISIIPEVAKDVAGVVDRLAYIYRQNNLDLPRDVSLAKTRKPFVPVTLERNIEREKLAVVETNALNLPGIVVDVVPVRKYIYGETIAHVLGYVGEISTRELERDMFGLYKSGDIIGKMGIEQWADMALKGESGGEQIEVNVNGRKLNVIGGVEALSGYNVVLTIDADLQKMCWDALQDRAGTVVMMNPRNGSVLAMVSKPSFDPNMFNRGISGENWNSLVKNPLCPMQNRAIAGQYPPGSTFKLVVAAAALEEGLITPKTSFLCTGAHQVANRSFRCWKKQGHGLVNLYRAIVESCDVYFYNVGSQIGVDTLAEYAKKFGLGAKASIALSGEREGLIPTKQWKLKRYHEPWQLGETIALSIGQGFILVTPLQLVRFYSALANGGTLYTPRLIKRIVTESGQIIEEFPPLAETRIPIRAGNLKVLQHALWGAVNEKHATGWVLRRPQRDVCGKTGTAQVVEMPGDEEDVEREDIPYKHRDHALFVCFAPRQNPEIVVAVIIEHGGHGGAAAAQVAREIIEGYFNRKQTVVDLNSHTKS